MRLGLGLDEAFPHGSRWCASAFPGKSLGPPWALLRVCWHNCRGTTSCFYRSTCKFKGHNLLLQGHKLGDDLGDNLVHIEVTWVSFGRFVVSFKQSRVSSGHIWGYMGAQEMPR